MGLLTDFRLSVMEQKLGVYGIVVHQNGQIIGEHRFRSDDRLNLCSASKTFVSVGVGIAEAEALLKLDDKLLDYFPKYKHMASKGSELITIGHLLKMTSGHCFEDFSRYNEIDRAELFFITELNETPGESFYYEDLCTYMLGRVIEKISGENLLSYLKPRLFNKLNIVNPQWHTCQKGHTHCSGGLYLTTEEFSRIGVLLLNNGIYNDKRIVTTSYIERMQSDWIDTSYKLDSESKQGYGYQIWKCTIPNSFRADGMYGQTCIVLKDYDAVITFTGHYEGYGSATIQAVWRDILPQLKV